MVHHEELTTRPLSTLHRPLSPHCPPPPALCTTNNGNCAAHAECSTDTDGKVVCTCAPGYTGDGTVTCTRACPPCAHACSLCVGIRSGHGFAQRAHTHDIDPQHDKLT